MRIDYRNWQRHSYDEERLRWIARCARAFAGTLFVTGLTFIAWKAPPELDPARVNTASAYKPATGNRLTTP